MLRGMQALFVLVVCVVSISAAAQETAPSPATEEKPTTGVASEPTEPPSPSSPPPSSPPAPAPRAKALGLLEGWQTSVTGYFRAPMALGISTRPNPDNLSGPSHTQVSYGPNRTVDASYYSFAYTRLQEQDWAELFIHEKKKHVEAVVGWMGYWYQAAGFRNSDAAWVPGMAYLTLDTDFAVGPIRPNIAITGGAWWPKFGTFDKYDTYTLGRFRQLGEQIKLTVPINPDWTAAVVHGFGTARDGSFNILVMPPYQSTVGADLVTYVHGQVTYKDYVDIGLHFNNEWTSDPNLNQQTTAGKSYSDVARAHLTTAGAEVSVSAPRAGHLWMSPSYIHVRNGWALGANGGTEVMHSLGGAGVATNYLAWTNSPSDSTGSGYMFNFGFLYENTLSGVLGQPTGSLLPEVTLNVFGLLADASMDLPARSTISQNSIRQFKYGADVRVQAWSWLAFLLRYDTVNYDLAHPGYIFSAITPRIIISSHFLSGESIYIQYSRYRYGDNMVLNGSWRWGTPLVAGNDIIQQGSYAGKKPDMDVIKLQASVAF